MRRVLRSERRLASLTENEDSLTRDIVTRLAEKWTLWTLAELASADAPLRFSRLLERVEGVSQKSLTKVLRQLERDGLVTREVVAQVPPRVEYATTTEPGSWLGSQLVGFSPTIVPLPPLVPAAAGAQGLPAESKGRR
jgi:DNA-binding HxlR family transcriptional regulator